MTGRYPLRGGVWHTIMGRSILEKNAVTMPQLFKQAGYRTGMFGKWHLGDNYPYRPHDRGFDVSLRLGGGGLHNYPMFGATITLMMFTGQTTSCNPLAAIARMSSLTLPESSSLIRLRISPFSVTLQPTLRTRPTTLQTRTRNRISMRALKNLAPASME